MLAVFHPPLPNKDVWTLPYTSQNVIGLKDREMLCSGLCSVIISSSSEQWNAALDALARPIISFLKVVTKEADQMTEHSDGMSGERTNRMLPVVNRLSDEIHLLAAVVGSFIRAYVRQNFLGGNITAIGACHRNSLISLLHTSWPYVTHIGSKYCLYEVSKQTTEM